MKRLFSVCLLMLCLSFPAFGGHTMPGGRYCEPVDNTTCFEGDPDPNVLANSAQDTSSNLGSEVLLILAVLAVLYRFKA